jgi:hypothetical protein
LQLQFEETLSNVAFTFKLRPMKPLLTDDSAWNNALETIMRQTAFKSCYQFQLAPLNLGPYTLGSTSSAARSLRNSRGRIGRAMHDDSFKTRVELKRS